MAYENILYEVEDRIATVILNRPEKRNALSWELREEFVDALKTAERDDEVKVIIIKGAGPSFSAGHVLLEWINSRASDPNLTASATDGDWPPFGVSPQFDGETAQWARACWRHWQTQWYLLKPVIAQVHGFCVAGGSEVASMCDIIFVAEDAQIGYPPMRTLAAPDVFWFPWRLPMGWAKHMALTGSPITGKEATQIGWARKCFPADRLDEETRKEAKLIASIDSDQLVMSKGAINQAYDLMGFRTVIEAHFAWFAAHGVRASVTKFTNTAKEDGLRAAIEEMNVAFEDYMARPQ